MADLLLLPDGSVKQEVVERIIPFFKVGYTFDIKQTEGEPLPELCHNLEGSLSDRQKQIKDILLDICPVPVRFQAISGDANGYYDLIQKEIVIDSSLSEAQSLKTLIHEMALKNSIRQTFRINTPQRCRQNPCFYSLPVSRPGHFGIFFRLYFQLEFRQRRKGTESQPGDHTQYFKRDD